MIGQKIYYFRKLNGLTQEQLATGICSVSHLSKIENGHETPSSDILEHLCKRLDISESDINSEEDIKAISLLLDEWYTLIVNRDKEAAIQKRAYLEEKFSHIQDPNLLLKYRLFTARHKLLLYNIDESGTLLKGLDPYVKSFDTDLEFYYYLFLGLYTYISGDYVEALECYKIAESAGDSLGMQDPELYYQLALTNSQLQHISHSINYASKALDLFDRYCNYVRSIDCQILLGINNRKIGNYQQTEKYYLNALKVAKMFNNKDLISMIYHNLGTLYSKDNPEKGIEYFQSSLKFREPHEHEKKARTLYCIAKDFYRLKDLKASHEWLEKGNEIASLGDLVEFKMHFQVLKYQLSNDITSELEEFLRDEVIPYFEKKKMWNVVAEYAETLASYYSNHFKYKSSSHYFSVVNESRKKMYSP
jgi:transcriptional regulator with XRE-family HTH domain